MYFEYYLIGKCNYYLLLHCTILKVRLLDSNYCHIHHCEYTNKELERTLYTIVFYLLTQTPHFSVQFTTTNTKEKKT